MNPDSVIYPALPKEAWKGIRKGTRLSRIHLLSERTYSERGERPIVVERCAGDLFVFVVPAGRSETLNVNFPAERVILSKKSVARLTFPA